MKKIILGIITMFIGISICNAKTMDISDIDTNTYIIGYRVFELNNYDISIYDVSLAIAEYVSLNDLNTDEINTLPIYFYSKTKGGYRLEQITGSLGGNLKVPVKVIKNITDVFKNKKLEVTYLNNNNLSSTESDSTKLNNYLSSLDNLIKEVASNLNNNYGFGNINVSNNNITINVQDKTEVFLSASSLILDNINKYLNGIESKTIINYKITLPDQVVLNGKVSDLKLNTLIKILRDVSKHLPNKSNNVKIDLELSLNKDKVSKKYNITINKQYV